MLTAWHDSDLLHFNCVGSLLEYDHLQPSDLDTDFNQGNVSYHYQVEPAVSINSQWLLSFHYELTVNREMEWV